MTKTFTRNDLIRYIYHETTESEKEEIEQELLFNNKLFEKYKDLAEVSMELDRVELSPSEKVVNKILNFSKTINLHSVR
jgi:hypothetical protein